jgi:hypothetical protein
MDLPEILSTKMPVLEYTFVYILVEQNDHILIKRNQED